MKTSPCFASGWAHPYRAYPSAHIAGTNGKGSTAAFLEAILRDAGFRTGLNTSPHLERINERIRISGEEISDEAFADVLYARAEAITEELLADGKLRAHPTYFECVTAMAFEYFAQQRVEFGVFEVGLGGRLDSTNILTPSSRSSRRIDFDHENFLGHSLARNRRRKSRHHQTGGSGCRCGAAAGSTRSDSKSRERTGLPVVETNVAYKIREAPLSDIEHGNRSETESGGLVTAKSWNRRLAGR